MIWIIAIFAAFPQWFSTMSKGFYLPLIVITAALIIKIVYFIFRRKKEGETWKKGWDIVMFTSSLLLAILFGMSLAILVKGVPIDKSMNYRGGLSDLTSIYTLFFGITGLINSVYCGILYLSFKTTGTVKEKARKVGRILSLIAIAEVLGAGSVFIGLFPRVIVSNVTP